MEHKEEAGDKGEEINWIAILMSVGFISESDIWTFKGSEREKKKTDELFLLLFVHLRQLESGGGFFLK